MSVIKSRDSIVLATGCKAYGGKYTKPEVIAYMNDDTTSASMYLDVQLHGLVAIDSTIVAGSYIGKIPNGLAHPEKALSFPAVTNGGIVRVQVESTGNITLEQGVAKSYIFLDSINYDNWLS